MAAVPSIGRADSAGDMTRVLYERYAPQLFRYCLHQLGSREEAEDAVQSTFLNAFRGIRRGVVPEQESAWLFKIAQNVCLSRRRSTWRRGRIESKADFEVVEEVTPAPTRLADELVGLQDALERMPPKQRRAILLREWKGLSYSEIAAELEVSQTAVETLIFRARRSLAQGLAEPPRPVRERRLVRGVDLGNVVTALKSLLLGGGAAAMKVAAVATVVGAGTVAVATPLDHRFHHVRPPTAAAPAPPRPEPAPVSTPPTVHQAEAVQPAIHPVRRPERVSPKPTPAPSPPAPATQAPATVDPAPPPAAAPPPPAADPTPPAPADAGPPVTAEASPSPPGDVQHAQETGQGRSGSTGPAVSVPSRDHGTAWGQVHGAAARWNQGQAQEQSQRPAFLPDERADQGPVQNDPSESASTAATAVPPPATPATVAAPADGSSPGDNANGSTVWSGNGQGQGDALGHGHSAEDYAALASSSPSSSWSRISASVSS